MKKLWFGLLLLGVGCSPSERYVKTVEKVQNKTVMIEVATIVRQYHLHFTETGIVIDSSTETVHYLGAGVFISPNGHILTASHLFTEGQVQSISVKQGDEVTTPAQLIIISTRKDLALIKIDRKHTPYAQINHKKARLGQEVIAVGNPRGAAWSSTKGIVSAVRTEEGEVYIQTDAAVNPGNSGGPLFDLSGKLVGIVVAVVRESDGMGIAVAINEIDDFLEVVRGL